MTNDMSTTHCNNQVSYNQSYNTAGLYPSLLEHSVPYRHSSHNAIMPAKPIKLVYTSQKTILNRPERAQDSLKSRGAWRASLEEVVPTMSEP